MGDLSNPSRLSKSHSPVSFRQLQPGNHLGCLTESLTERRRILTRFVRAGLHVRAKVLLIHSRLVPLDLAALLRLRTKRDQKALEEGQLAQLDLSSEQISAETLLASIQEQVKLALEQGWPQLWVALDWPTQSLRRSRFEDRLNQELPSLPCVVLCLFDAAQDDSVALVAAAPAHDWIAHPSGVYPHFFQQAAEAPTSSDQTLQVWLKRLHALPQSGEGEDETREELSPLEWVRQLNHSFDPELSPPGSQWMTDSATDWEFWLNPEGRYVYNSPACERITGYTPLELIENPDLMIQMVHPDDRQQFSDHLWAHHDQITSSEIEFRILRADGELCWIGHVCQSVFDSDGAYLGRRGSNRDITHRKQAELELRRHTELWQALAEASQAFHQAGTDWGGLLSLVVRQAAELIGDGCVLTLFSPDGQTAQVVATHHANPGAAEMMQTDIPRSPFPIETSEIMSAARQGQVVVLPGHHLKDLSPDRQARHERFQREYGTYGLLVVPLRAQGEVIGALGLTREANRQPFASEDLPFLQGLADRAALAIANTRLIQSLQAELHERQRAEALMRAGEERFRIISELTSDFAFSLAYNAEHRLYQEWLIGALGRVLKDPQADLCVLDVLAHVHPDEQAQVRGWLDRLLQGEPGQTQEIRLVGHQGNVLWFQIYIRPVWNTDQTAVIGLVGAGQDITERRQAEEAERAQRALSDALREVAAVFASTLELDQVLAHTLDLANRVTAYDAINLMLIEDGQARIVACKGYDELGLTEPLRHFRMPVKDTPSLRTMVESGQALVISNVQQDQRWVNMGLDYLRSYAGAPIQVKGQTIGFLNIDSFTPNFFTSAHAEPLLAFAQQAGVALENARLFDEVQGYARHSALLNDIIRLSISAPNLHNMLQRMVDRIGELFGSDGVFLTLWNAEAKTPIPTAAFGPGRDAFLRDVIFPEEHTLTEEVLQRGRAMVIEDSMLSPYALLNNREHFGIRSALALPLIADNNKLGAAVVYFSTPHHFTQQEIALGTQASAQVALAVARLQLMETERQRSFELARSNALIAALSSTSSRLETTQEPDQIMEVIGAELRQLGVNSLVVLVNDVDKSARLSYISVESTVLRLIDKLMGVQVLGMRFGPNSSPFPPGGDRKPVFIPNPLEMLSFLTEQADSPNLQRAARLAGLGPETPLIIVPLLFQDQLIGALSIWGADLRHEDTPVYAIFASQVAAALQNARLFHQVQQLAITDELTGLYNRRGLFELGQHEVERALRLSHPLSVMLLDIDHFKLVNDTYGHTTGDQVLRILAAHLRQYVREIDIVGRYGGEEFVILLVESDQEAAAQVAERLRLTIQQQVFETDRGELKISVSLGVVQTSSCVDSLDQLIDQADAALYQAKQSGRNQVSIYSCKD